MLDPTRQRRWHRVLGDVYGPDTVQLAMDLAEAENADLTATLDRIRAVLVPSASHTCGCSVWGVVPVLGDGPGPCDCVLADLRAALDAQP